MRVFHVAASASLIALTLLCVAWELWLTPVRNGGSAMVLKGLVLLLPLFGVLRGKLYTYQWSSMLIFAYFMEGVVRAWSEHGPGQAFSLGEIALSLVFFIAAIGYARLARSPTA